MIPLATLKRAVQRALRQVSRAKGVIEAEVFASGTDHLLCRLNYTSHIPCQGVEEPKSSESFGIGIQARFTDPHGPRRGFGSEARDFSPDGIHRAIEKARHNAVYDPEFVSLPGHGKVAHSATRLPRSSDRAILEMKDATLVEVGWRVLNGALKTFSESDRLLKAAGLEATPASLGLIVGGDVSVFRQRMAIGSTGMPKIQTDESTAISAAVTAMIERAHAKGSGYAAATHLGKFKGEAGSEAARNAIASMDGQRLPTGTYRVVLGPQPVADLLANVLLPSLGVDAFYRSQSTFMGELGREVASESVTLYDHGAARGGVGTKRLTCEGLPTGRTDLIREGVLTGLLSSHYETQRMLRDPAARDKLGVPPQDHLDSVAPRNGFRLSNRGGRQFDVLPAIAATNVYLESPTPHTTESLLRIVGDGVYIGRIWYTYPMNGLRAGDFTCTVVGDSYRIRDGKLAEPLRGNTIRISDNIRRLLRHVSGVSKQARPIIGWAAEEVVYAPDVVVEGMPLFEIAQYMDSV
jgi:predicted Zn-dependent protease